MYILKQVAHFPQIFLTNSYPSKHDPEQDSLEAIISTLKLVSYLLQHTIGHFSVTIYK